MPEVGAIIKGNLIHKKMNTILLLMKKKRTDFYRSALFVCLLLIAVLTGGCTVIEPGFVTTTDDSVIQIVDEDNDIITIDEATGAITSIDYAHHEIHEGCSYIVQENDDDLDNGQTLDLTVITPNTTSWMHSVWSAEGTKAIHIFVYEGVTTNISGVARTPVNRDRNSSNMPSGIFREGDTFVALGTLLWQWHTGDKKISGIGEERDEFLLRQNTQYLFRIESEVNDNAVTGQLSFYEHAHR